MTHGLLCLLNEWAEAAQSNPGCWLLTRVRAICILGEWGEKQNETAHLQEHSLLEHITQGRGFLGLGYPESCPGVTEDKGTKAVLKSHIWHYTQSKKLS